MNNDSEKPIRVPLAKLRWVDGQRLPVGKPEIVEYPETLAKKLIDRHSGHPEPVYVPLSRLGEFGFRSEPVKTKAEIEAETLEAENKRLAEEQKQREFDEMKAENERLKALAKLAEESRRSEVEAKKPEHEAITSNINLSQGSEIAKTTLAKEPKVKKIRQPKT